MSRRRTCVRCGGRIESPMHKMDHLCRRCKDNATVDKRESGWTAPRVRVAFMRGVSVFAPLLCVILFSCANDAQLGFQPAGHHNSAKVAEKMSIGDKAHEDLLKNNEIMEVELVNRAQEIKTLKQQIAKRDIESSETHQTMKNQAETISQLRQEITGRDRWDLSGGGFWIVIAAIAGFVVLLIVIFALLSFTKWMAKAVYDLGTPGVASYTKGYTQKGINPIRRLGGVLGDIVIKANKVNMRKKRA